MSCFAPYGQLALAALFALASCDRGPNPPPATLARGALSTEATSRLTWERHLRSAVANGPQLIDYRADPSPADVCIFVVHENEVTGYQVALEAVMDGRAHMLRIEQAGDRNVDFNGFMLDPNRMFSNEGRARSFALLNDASPSPGTLRKASRFATQALQAVEECIAEARVPGLITLHNNTDGRYSILSYKAGGSEAKAAAALHLSSRDDPDDFVLTTDSSLFRFLSSSDKNVVLQSKNPPDDGSLSVVFAHRGYVNIEAQHGHQAQQRAMLNLVLTALADPPSREPHASTH